MSSVCVVAYCDVTIVAMFATMSLFPVVVSLSVSVPIIPIVSIPTINFLIC